MHRYSTLSRTLIAALVAVVGVTLAFSSAAEAQRNTNGGFAREANPNGRTQRVYEAGKFDYYVMSLSWSPSFCAGQSAGSNDPQCNGRSGRPYAFVLHGVWPQFEKGWPQDCQTADRGFVPRPVATRMLDIMPSERLIFHEYRKHGTCSGLGVDGFFDLSRSLYNKVKIPQRYQTISDPRTFVATPELIADFVAANPGMKPDGIAVDCGGPGPRLREIRICFDKAGNFRSCGRNENQSRMCSSPRIYVPPVRASAGQRSIPAAAGQRI